MARGWTIMGLGVSTALLVAALWAWNSAASVLHLGMGDGPQAAWAMRCGAVAAGALGQVLALSVLMRIYRRDVVSEVLRLSGLLLFMAAGVSAVALGLAGR